MKESKEISKKTAASEEIDLNKLLILVRQGFNSVFHAFLSVFLYLKSRAIILAVLFIVGVALGYGLKKISPSKKKIEVIVKPNLESKNYLYDAVEEIQANIEGDDIAFFDGLELDGLAGFEIAIEPTGELASNTKEEMKYLELLQNFQTSGFVDDVLRSEILNKSSLNHRIQFGFREGDKGELFAKWCMAYINDNPYYQEILKISRENAEQKIEQNQVVIGQIDNIIANYSDQMGRDSERTGEGRIVLDNEDVIDVTGLLNLKNNLIVDTERRRLQLRENKDAISIINFGRPQHVIKPLFGKKMVWFPALLVSLFLLFDLFKYLNRKALELKNGQ